MQPPRADLVERIRNAVRALSVAERKAYLDGACGNDSELRREVEAGLSAPETETLAAPAAVGVGFTIGQYKIESKLGEGGMGSVYLAHDSKLHRPVAIKFLSCDLADATARQRFQQEARMASSLNHPHIVTVHDAGELDGRQYLVTEFVDGGALKSWAATARPGWKEVVSLLIGVADGLATAHQAGMVHRDFKPANILVSKSGYAKLADFGLAKLVEAAPLGAPHREEYTGPGMIVGTIAYMSPEQTAGKALDARSDMFSFGVVLYELLAGRHPFAGITGLELLQAIAHAEPPPLPEAIPAPLRALVEKAMEKDPADRYQSMRDVVAELKRIEKRTVLHPPAAASAPAPAPVVAAAAISSGTAAPQTRPPRLALGLGCDRESPVAGRGGNGVPAAKP